MTGNIYWLSLRMEAGEDGELDHTLVTQAKFGGPFQRHKLTFAEAAMICAWIDSPQGRSGKGRLHFPNNFCMLLRG